jgi:two-component system, OmpR family, alkaline phosphatase synthesis response regulator PhoP
MAKKVLIADDDEKFRVMIANALKQAGFGVVEAVDGGEAVKKAQTEKPDVMLIDIMMPIKLGFEVLEELKADPTFKDTPIFTLSHLAQPSDVEKVKRLGATEHLIKTELSVRELVDKVSNAPGAISK